jgi:hypothetical protein
LASIESETDALTLIDRLLESVVADEALVEGGRARLKRIEDRAEKRRDVLQAMMEQIGEKIERPLATLSLSNGRRTAVITDQAGLPEGYWRRSVDRLAIEKDLKAGKAIPGAELSNGANVLYIRSK